LGVWIRETKSWSTIRIAIEGTNGLRKIRILCLLVRRSAMPVIGQLIGGRQVFLMYFISFMSCLIVFGMGLIRDRPTVEANSHYPL
jgi:hypothetical protein